MALHESLIMIRTAVQENENRPLSPESLISVITPDVNQCRMVLEELFSIVNGTRRGLDSHIGRWWHPVWQNRWNGEELVLLRMKLSQSCQLFHEFQLALKSYVLFNSSGVTNTDIPLYP